ncbi:hypothetical protein [Jannaschia seohaensis]|uniref:Uncharacterized protein n=1 Tax=Jannaschia seohaensis TaxID=475081 RepID=A0A2Y9B1R2_9RHOB|nr:hypothetical protein [Jannaschia seohaensis]PWJ16979.1 hypothetical protein BCF38_10792 [Jannaschia seohaensis]SSA48269.1 hypothetical protein SAMN05421539_10792 [Jannaschia seohaensis]
MPFTLLPRDPRIHVFSVSDGSVSLAHQTYLSRLEEAPPEGATPLRDAFGAEIDTTYAEVFAISDIAPLSLRDYLAQAHDIPAETLAAQAARLDALSGDVAVLAPRAVEGLSELHPRPELTHIGSFAPAEVDNVPRELPPAAKTPGIATPAAATGAPLQRRKITLIVLAALVLVVLLAVVL